MISEVVLDPSRENAIPAEFTVVDTEIDFLRLDGTTNRLWVRGEHLCRWVNELYRVRGSHSNLILKELPSPRMRLRALIGTRAEEVSPETLKRVFEILDQGPEITLGQLLAKLTGDEFWYETPSIEHAAKWLLAEWNEELLPLVEAQRERWEHNISDESLKGLYDVPSSGRKALLKEWLLADSGNALGFFPLTVEGNAADLIQEEWGRRLRATKGGVIEKFSPKNPNAAHIAHTAFEYFRQNATNLTPGIAARISSCLEPLEKVHLEKLIPKPCPPPLALEATVEEALSWTLNKYLPYRQWQVYASADCEGEIEQLGNSFADWILSNYPKLTTRSREESYLNVRAHYLVSALMERYVVLWVVVDGLNYANHQLLLRLLGQSDAELGVVEDLAVFSILPTITKTAKYGLTSGMFPLENSQDEWDTQKTFQSSFPHGEYAGETQVDRLHSALANETATLCYWNMTAIDAYYHKQTDPHAIGPNIEFRLKALAQIISDVVMNSKSKDRIAVVISTDHGQMIGPCTKLDCPLKEIPAHGRTAYGNLFNWDPNSEEAYIKSPDDSMVVLNPVAFRLNEPTTLALKSYYFGGWTKDSQGRAWGVHGGLYPEEVVVGLSVLTRKPRRKLVTAIISGTGEVGKPGTVSLHIDNPNSAHISSVTIFINEIEEYLKGQPLLADVPQSTAEDIKIPIQKFPPPLEGETLHVTGSLLYEFEDGIQHECEVTGTLTCRQMYSGQRPSLRDRFKR